MISGVLLLNQAFIPVVAGFSCQLFIAIEAGTTVLVWAAQVSRIALFPVLDRPERTDLILAVICIIVVQVRLYYFINTSNN